MDLITRTVIKALELIEENLEKRAKMESAIARNKQGVEGLRVGVVDRALGRGLKRSFDEMNEQLAKRPEIYGYDDQMVYCMTFTPFAEHIVMEEPPTGFEVPSLLRMYDGSTDPDEHISHFKLVMSLVKVPREKKDAMWCKAFAASLQGNAVRWIMSLERFSIDSFLELANAFVRHFCYKRRAKKSVYHLFSVWQGKDESLAEYDRRFKNEVMETDNCNEVTALIAFQRGLIPGSRLANSLVGKKAATLEEAFERAEGFIRLDEELEKRRQRCRN